MTDVRKTFPQLKTEMDSWRRMYNRTFVHNNTKDQYQLLFVAFDEHTNECQAVYCVCAAPWLKFVRPISEFAEKFTDLGELK